MNGASFVGRSDGAMIMLFLIAAAMWCALIYYAATKSWWD